GTLMCHYRHRAHTDPLILTGLQDMTAHVDFSSVAEAAVQQQLNVSGFTNQATFLLNCGILDFLSKQNDPVDHYHLAQEIKRLTLPSEMGELFKVIALTRQYDHDLIGFSRLNQVERL
ncbi:MAG TPA: SAM-dependent methyltransferase, partial [Gammaproteobacteria bacterium]|nr:SAM-dependent methyltransferase [Gammaproteobacteria bacterium]